MKSPFPGMDPYIEACGFWEGFHNHLIESIYRYLSQKVPPGYAVDTGVRTYIVMVEHDGKDGHDALPDVTIAETPARRKQGKKGATAVVEPDPDAESVSMQAFIVEEFREAFVEVFTKRKDRQLVTSIEVLSPTNKRPGTEGYNLYTRKRQAMLLGRANFIEIDFIRGEPKLPMLTEWPVSPYAILVSRQTRAPFCRAWKADFQQTLPAIPVPLLEGDADLRLDLQSLVDELYAIGRYHEHIDYTIPVTPPFSEAEARWWRDRSKQAAPRNGGKRSSKRE